MELVNLVREEVSKRLTQLRELESHKSVEQVKKSSKEVYRYFSKVDED